MKFDVIIGNPPYNRGIVKKGVPEFNHKAMDHSKSGHIGFLIHCLDFLNEGGILEFITPAKFLMDVNSIDTRNWLFENFNVEEVKYYECKDVFPSVSIETIVVFKIRKGKTNVINVSYKDFSYNVKPENYVNHIVPKFDNKISLSIYLKMSSKKHFFPKYKSYNIKDNSNKNAECYSDTKNEYYKYKTLKEIKDGIPLFYFSSVRTNNNKWRVVSKEMSATNFVILEPDIETNYTFYSVLCNSKKEAYNIKRYTETNLFKLIKEYFRISLNSQCWLSNIPMVNFDFKTEEELYEYFGFNNEEIEYINSTRIGISK